MSQEWDLLQFPKSMRQHLCGITNDCNRENAKKVINTFEEIVSPRLPFFRRSVIHSDVNSENVIVRQGTGEDQAYQVAGFIDFNDCILTCTIFELGVSLAHLMRDILVPASPIETVELVGPLLRGYSSVIPLTEAEFDSLLHIMLARSVMVAVYSEHTHIADPVNTEHIVTSISKFWTFIKCMLSLPKGTVNKIWAKYLTMTVKDS